MESILYVLKIIKSIEFSRPWAFYLFFLIILISTLVYFLLLKRGRPNMQFSSFLGIHNFKKTIRTRFFYIPPVLRLLTLILLAITIAGPYTKYSFEKVYTEGIDIIISLDVSGSMLAEDFKPNRIEAAKKEAIRFIENRSNDRFGLVIFSRDAITMCPLTTDRSALINIISKIQYGYLEDGTAIGLGLALGALRLQESNAKSKVIILLTDGVNNAGEISPQQALEIAKENNIRVYTIGIGTIGEALYPIKTPFGIDKTLMKVEIDEELLKQIANETGGKYFRATDEKKLKAIYDEIDALEKTKIETFQHQRKNELFFIPLSASIILFTLEIIIRTFVLRNPLQW